MKSILISGGGIIGLSAACALAKQGFAITLIESQVYQQPLLIDPTSPSDLRVFAFNQASQQFLKEIDVWSLVEKSRYCFYDRMQVWDSVADGEIIFSAQECGETQLGTIIEQKVLLGALWQKVRQIPNIHVIEDCQIIAVEYSPQHITAKLSNDREVSAQLCIIAEGAHSPLRDLIGIETHTQSYYQSAIVATIKSTLSHRQTAFQRFSAEGPLAWLPLWDPFLTSIVWSNATDTTQQLCNLSEAEFNQVLMRESAGVLGDLAVISERKIFALKRQHAHQYGSKRCVLVGDAAHTIHPLAGQGINCGFRDLRCLLETINIAVQKNRDMGSDVFIGHYQRHARWANQAALAVMEMFHRGFRTQQPWIMSLRNAGLNGFNQRPRLKQWMMRAAQGAF